MPPLELSVLLDHIIADEAKDDHRPFRRTDVSSLHVIAKYDSASGQLRKLVGLSLQ